MLPLLFHFKIHLAQNKRTKKFMKMYYEALAKNMFMRPLFFISYMYTQFFFFLHIWVSKHVDGTQVEMNAGERHQLLSKKNKFINYNDVEKVALQIQRLCLTLKCVELKSKIIQIGKQLKCSVLMKKENILIDFRLVYSDSALGESRPLRYH